MNMAEHKVVVACYDANGIPVLRAVRVECTGAEYADGEHYLAAEDWAMNCGYEAPMVFFDEADMPEPLVRYFTWDLTSEVRV